MTTASISSSTFDAFSTTLRTTDIEITTFKPFLDTSKDDFVDSTDIEITTFKPILDMTSENDFDNSLHIGITTIKPSKDISKDNFAGQSDIGFTTFKPFQDSSNDTSNLEVTISTPVNVQPDYDDITTSKAIEDANINEKDIIEHIDLKIPGTGGSIFVHETTENPQETTIFKESSEISDANDISSIKLKSSTEEKYSNLYFNHSKIMK